MLVILAKILTKLSGIIAASVNVGTVWTWFDEPKMPQSMLEK